MVHIVCIEKLQSAMVVTYMCEYKDKILNVLRNKMLYVYLAKTRMHKEFD